MIHNLFPEAPPEFIASDEIVTDLKGVRLVLLLYLQSGPPLVYRAQAGERDLRLPYLDRGIDDMPQVVSVQVRGTQHDIRQLPVVIRLPDDILVQKGRQGPIVGIRIHIGHRHPAEVIVEDEFG